MLFTIDRWFLEVAVSITDICMQMTDVHFLIHSENICMQMTNVHLLIHPENVLNGGKDWGKDGVEL